MYFRNDVDLDITTMNTFAADLRDWMTTNLLPGLSNQLSFTSILVTDLTAEFSPVIEFTSGLPVSGADTNDPLPPQNAMCITLLTDSRGRSFRGRNYIPGWGEGNQSSGVFDDSVVTYVQDAYGILLLSTETGNFKWVVVSRYHDNAPRVSGVTTHVTHFRANSIVASQRRRRLGVGS